MPLQVLFQAQAGKRVEPLTFCYAFSYQCTLFNAGSLKLNGLETDLFHDIIICCAVCTLKSDNINNLTKN